MVITSSCDSGGHQATPHWCHSARHVQLEHAPVADRTPPPLTGRAVVAADSSSHRRARRRRLAGRCLLASPAAQILRRHDGRVEPRYGGFRHIENACVARIRRVRSFVRNFCRVRKRSLASLVASQCIKRYSAHLHSRCISCTSALRRTC